MKFPGTHPTSTHAHAQTRARTHTHKFIRQVVTKSLLLWYVCVCVCVHACVHVFVCVCVRPHNSERRLLLFHRLHAIRHVLPVPLCIVETSSEHGELHATLFSGGQVAVKILNREKLKTQNMDQKITRYLSVCTQCTFCAPFQRVLGIPF